MYTIYMYIYAYRTDHTRRRVLGGAARVCRREDLRGDLAKL